MMVGSLLLAVTGTPTKQPASPTSSVSVEDEQNNTTAMIYASGISGSTNFASFSNDSCHPR